MKSVFFKSLCIFLSSIIIGLLLLILVYLLPTSIIRKNAKESINTLLGEGLYPKIILEEHATQLDNFTDAIMLQNATYNGKENALIKALNAFKYDSINYTSPIDSLNDSLNAKPTRQNSYSRYWHGYLIFLKPLLLLFNYEEIRVINILLESILIFSIIYLFIKRKNYNLAFAYSLSILTIYPNVIYLSLQFSTIFYIFNLGIIYLLLRNDNLKTKNNYLFYFLILGILTSYFDFLTYPITTIGVPLIVYLSLNYDEQFWKNIKTIILSGMMWGIGYFGMWASKWIITSLILKDNTLLDAIKQILYRTKGKGDVTYSPIKSVLLNLNNFKLMFILTTFILLIYILIKCLKKDIKFEKNNILKYLPILLLCALPLVWYFVTANHSTIHAWFTYRSLIILAFGLYTYILYLFPKNS